MKSIKDLNEEKEKIKKYSEPDNPLQNIADDVGKTQIDSQIEILKEVLELIDETKLPDDKDYRYSNEYIDSWIEELKQKITGDYKQESEGGTKT